MIYLFKFKLYKMQEAQKMSIIEKIKYPQSSCSVKLHVQGIFGLPQQWKTTDESNPGLFTYVARTWRAQITKGKVYPRELTEKQLKEQQEAKKKGGKKQAKKEQNAVQQERLRKMKQQEQINEKIREQQWSKLTEQQKIYRTAEDQYKSAQLRFENNLSDQKMGGKDYIILNERITVDGGQWIYIYKLPTSSEEDLAKLKKSKPKNLNLNDLNPIIMRAWMDLSELNSKDKSSTTIRCKILQVDRTPDTSEPNLEKTYIKINISLEKPFILTKDGIQSTSFIKNPPVVPDIPPEVSCVNQLHAELRLAIESLAMEYSVMFWKELNIQEQQKNTLIFTNSKKNQLTKRKQQFLYDFNVSGKYKILKDRIKRSIVNICKHKYADVIKNQTAFTGIYYDQRDKFYSQIYNFLVNTYKETMGSLIWEKMQSLGETQVTPPSTKKNQINAYIDSYIKEEITDGINRITHEHQTLFQYSYGEKIYQKYIKQYPKDTSIKYKYAIYCLKNNLGTPVSILPYFEQHFQYNKDSSQLKLIYLLILISSEEETNLKKAWIIVRELLQNDPQNNQYLMLGNLLLQLYLKDQQAGKNCYFLCERNYLRKNGKLNKHKQNPSPTQIPSINSLASYQNKISGDFQDQMWLSIGRIFISYNLFQVCSKITNKIKNRQNPFIKVVNIKVQIAEGHFEEALNNAINLYTVSPSEQILDLLLKILFTLKKYDSLEKYLKISFKNSSSDNRNLALLRLSKLYIETQNYANAKACLVKYIEKNPQNSGLSWLYLGLCQLKTNNTQNQSSQNSIDQAIQCFRHSNLLDPNNSKTWDNLAIAYVSKGNFIMVNQALNQSFLLSAQPLHSIVKSELLEKLKIIEPSNFYQKQIKERIYNRLTHQI